MPTGLPASFYRSRTAPNATQRNIQKHADIRPFAAILALCKTSIPGSNPGGASNFPNEIYCVSANGRVGLPVRLFVV